MFLILARCQQQPEVIKHDKVPKINFTGNNYQLFHFTSDLTRPDRRKIRELTASLTADSQPQISIDFLARVIAV